ncbi:sulfocyanin-like copper-binding protein [Microvirga sp. P5_D2]
MLAHFARLALVVLAFWNLPGAAQAGKPFVPSWIRNDPAARTVAVEIVADWNLVARYAKDNVRTDIIDFNGDWGGNLTISVPTGWSVRLTFINHSGAVRHGLMVTRSYAESEMPVRLREEDAIWGAYVRPLGGHLPAGERAARLRGAAAQGLLPRLLAAEPPHDGTLGRPGGGGRPGAGSGRHPRG